MAERPARRRLSQSERENQIIQATIRIIAERGYAAASLEAVAEVAEVSKGLISHYFGSRETLMRRTAEEALGEIRRAVADSVDMYAPLPQVLRETILAAALLSQNHTARLRALQQIVLNLRDSEGAQILTVHDYEDTYASQEEMFRRGQDSGDIRSDLDPRILAVSYQGAVDGMLAYLDAHPSVDPHHYAAQFATAFLEGLQVGRRHDSG